jgi:hypothetical protein
MRREPHAQIEITGCGAADTLFALAGHAHARSFADAGRNANVNGAGMAVVFEREAPRGAVVRIFEGELDLVFDVASMPLPRPPTAAAPRTSLFRFSEFVIGFFFL